MPRPIRARSTWHRAGSGNSTQLAGELFKLMTGIDMVHVPYRGGAPAMSDLIAGQVQVMFAPARGASTLGVESCTRLR